MRSLLTSKGTPTSYTGNHAGASYGARERIVEGADHSVPKGSLQCSEPLTQPAVMGRQSQCPFQRLCRQALAPWRPQAISRVPVGQWRFRLYLRSAFVDAKGPFMIAPAG